MTNILKILIPFIIVCYISIGIGIGCFILRKHKHYILVGMLFLIMGITGLFLETPYYKDISQQKLEVYTGIYNMSRSEATAHFGQAIMFDTQKVEFIVPTFSNYIKNLEKGKEYKVTYYVNSRVVYSIEPIE